MLRFVQIAVILTAAILCGAVRAASNTTFELRGPTGHFRVTSGNGTVDVAVGRVYEATAAGARHAIPSFAALLPEMDTGAERGRAALWPPLRDLRAGQTFG